MFMKKLFFVGLALFLLVSCSADKHSKLVAHRGYWQTENSHENSISSLKNAIALRVYGSECDVRQTADGVLVLFHNAKLDDGRVIGDMTYKDIADYTLPNGEKLPLFDDALTVMKDAPSDFRLVIEVKSGDVKDIVAAVERHGLQDKVEYIAFGREHCLELIALNKNLKVSYLASNDKNAWTPEELKNKGFYGLDYSSGLLDAHPEWIEEAHKLGLDVNVWTVNKKEDIERFLKAGADKVTTDIPNVYK